MQGWAELTKSPIITSGTFVLIFFPYNICQEVSYQMPSLYNILQDPKPRNPGFLPCENREELKGLIPFFEVTYPCHWTHLFGLKKYCRAYYLDTLSLNPFSHFFEHKMII
jgi:hypothetical protein